MPRKPAVKIRETGSDGMGEAKYRKVYISWLPHNLIPVKDWVALLRDFLSVDLDPFACPVTIVTPGWRDDTGQEDSAAGTMVEAVLRDARKDVTDFVVVGTSHYINQQKKQVGGSANVHAPASDLYWFLIERPKPAPVCWIAFLDPALELGEHRLGEVNLGRLHEWHRLNDENVKRFPYPTEDIGRCTDAIGSAKKHLLSHDKRGCPICNV